MGEQTVSRFSRRILSVFLFAVHGVFDEMQREEKNECCVEIVITTSMRKEIVLFPRFRVLWNVNCKFQESNYHHLSTSERRKNVRCKSIIMSLFVAISPTTTEENYTHRSANNKIAVGQQISRSGTSQLDMRAGRKVGINTRVCFQQYFPTARFSLLFFPMAYLPSDGRKKKHSKNIWR